MNGVEHIAQAFNQARQENRAALIPYFTLGYPTIADTLGVVHVLAGGGADLIELGVPFSDPLADGPTIQHSTQVALENGMTVAGCLRLVREIRASGVKVPILLMGYVNPILAYGMQQYVDEAGRAGVDGFIVPDLPLEEAGSLEAACRESGLALVYLATPGSSEDRLRLLANHTSGFLYLVSLNGVTGARQSLPEGVETFIQRARAAARTPVAVGFGIATPEQAALVGRSADGVIIGSALIDAVGRADRPANGAEKFIRSIRGSMVSRGQKIVIY